ncbi:MAG: hypothetical protein HOH88_03265, partial [Flavobacteriales bacterium]|nr:hypothetical protein [Flavobacteriales bacterium]
MIFRKIIFILSLTLFCFNTNGQSTYVLDWGVRNINEKEISSFENSTYLSEYNELPVFQQNIEIKNSEYYDISVSNMKFTNVSDNEARVLQKLDVSDTVFYSSEILKSANKHYNRIFVFPYIKTTNNYKKITEFTINKTKKKIIPQQKKTSIKINSVLASSNWYKISVNENAVYKLSFSDLETLGVSTSNLNINSIRLYGNGGGMLPRLNSDYRHEDLQENAIEIIDNNNNGIFESGDYLLFYGESVDVWSPYDNYIGKYHHYKH